LNQIFSTPIRVYIEDTDAGGIVYYVNYLKYMERSRTELFRYLGFPKPAIISEDKLLVVADAKVSYRRSAVLDDLLTVSSNVVKVARSYLVLAQTVSRIEGENVVTLAAGEIKLACVKRDSRKACGIPENVLLAVNDYLRDQTL